MSTLVALQTVLELAGSLAKLALEGKLSLSDEEFSSLVEQHNKTMSTAPHWKKKDEPPTK
jgi:hypothetical protein